jgi:16S rRNA (guanine966-N2)-methyltransferase
MRVIAGKLGGRAFKSPDSHRTHPMSDKVRGAIFNTLGDITGLTVLDAFAGSGALSIEAASRGAASITAIDVDKRAHTTIEDNVTGLKISHQVKAIRANAYTWSDLNQDKLFDIVMLDPPYDTVRPDLLQKLTRHTRKGGIVVLSHPPNVEINFSGLSSLTSKSYGDAQLEFFRKD